MSDYTIERCSVSPPLQAVIFNVEHLVALDLNAMEPDQRAVALDLLPRFERRWDIALASEDEASA